MIQAVVIASPPAGADISDRSLECEFALEPAFLDLVHQAQQAGWKSLEIDLVLVSLADNHMLGEMENLRTNQAIQEALRRRKAWLLNKSDGQSP
jgi:hypothetical protein